MRAATISAYGLDRIDIGDQPVPEPDPHQVRVRVSVASINPADWHLAAGEPRFLRLTEGLRRPKKNVVGTDGAGVVESVGDEVADLAVGDRVFGKFEGSFAELAVADVDRLAKIPNGVTDESAAGLPIAGVTALQAIEKGQVDGRSVVVNGASGGVGHYAIQLARAFGAREVTAVCSGRNLELVASLGADRVVDYGSTDFTDDRHDVIIECAGGRTAAEYFRGLSKPGHVVLVGPDKGGRNFGPIAKVVGLMGRFAISPHKLSVFVADETAERLRVLAELYASGAIRTVVDRSFPLGEVTAAFEYLGTQRARGKVLVLPTDRDGEPQHEGHRIADPRSPRSPVV